MGYRILCIAMYQSEEVENKITQLRKGILELAILSSLYRTTHYGYSLVREMTASGAIDLKEGTIYPILSRLSKEGLVASKWMESNQGPPRKYYTLTASGRAMCEALSAEFGRLVQLVGDSARDAESGRTAEKDMKSINVGKSKP